MDSITQKELREMMLVSCDKINKEKEQINKINVFPVPDQDTGNNFAKTLLGIKGVIENKEFKNTAELSETILDGALTNAQGNAGVIYTGFLAGFLPDLKNIIDLKNLSTAFEKGNQRAKTSIQDPKEGTILDVINAFALSLQEENKKNSNLITAFQESVKKASQALLATREKMEIFQKANVVDAGGLGFLMILESWLAVLENKTMPQDEKKEGFSEKVKRFVQVLANRYEVVSLVEDSKLNEKQVKEKLKKLGDCLDVVKIKNKMKIHIHTDHPDEVKEIIIGLGTIQSLRIEDMSDEVAGEESVRVLSASIVTDQETSILDKIKDRYDVLQTKGTEKEYQDSFRKQLEKHKNVLCLTSSSKLHSSYNNALGAKELMPNPGKVIVIDSKNASAGQALLILKALELIQQQDEIEEIYEKIKRLAKKIYTYIVIKDPKEISKKIKGITKSQIRWLRKARRFNLYPVLELRKGVVKKGGVVLAKSTTEAIFKKISKASKKERRSAKIRIVINHINDLNSAQSLKKEVKEKLGAQVQFISEESSSLLAPLGKGALIASWMPF